MADTSLYRTILEAVSGRLMTLLEPSGWDVVLLGQPTYSGTHAGLPTCVVAPRSDLAESIGQETFNNEAFLEFAVFVGLFVDAQSVAGLEQSYKRAAAREVVRLDLWKPGAPGLGAEWFDCDYDPFGLGGQNPPNANVEGSWQKFTFSVSTARQSV